MAVTEKITDYTNLAYDRLLGQFKDKPIIKAILKTWTDLLQEVENDLYSLMSETLFLTGKGKNLERYGQLLNLYLPDGMTDSEYRELIIAEIMRRSSDGTPDKIRKIIEATTGVYNTKFFEHYNAKSFPYTLGCNFMYGYGEKGDINFNLSYETKEAKYLQWASPVTTGSCVLGLHTTTPSSLLIPAELDTPLEKLGLSSNKTINPSFDKDLSSWTYISDKITWLETFTDPYHPEGVLLMNVNGTTESPDATTKLQNIENGREYIITAEHINDQGYGGKIMAGSTPYSNDLGEYVASGNTILSLLITVSDINNTYITIVGNTTSETDYLAKWNNVEVYDNVLKYDQDELVNAVDDWIVVKTTTKTSTTISTLYGSARLAELANNPEQFQVDSESDIEDFYVDIAGKEVDRLFVNSVEVIKPEEGIAIALEISQILYNEEV